MHDTLIIIPAYNEELHVGRVIEGLQAHGPAADILVINDGSVDRTASVADSYPGVTVLTHPTNIGYGAALESGYRYAAAQGYEYLLQFDADGQHHTEDLAALVDALRSGTCELAIGSRFVGDPHYRPEPAKRFAMRLFRDIIHFCTGIRISDPTSGLRGLHRSLFTYYVESGKFPNDYPDANIVIQTALAGFRIQETPAHSRERTAGTSMHSGLKPAVYMITTLLRIGFVLVNHLFDTKLSGQELRRREL